MMDRSSSEKSPKCELGLLLRRCTASGTIKFELKGVSVCSCPPVAAVLARKRMAGERVERCDQVEFDVVEVADIMGWQLPLVKRGLRQLQWSTDRCESGPSRAGESASSQRNVWVTLTAFLLLHPVWWCRCSWRTERRVGGILRPFFLLPLVWRPEPRGDGQTLSFPPRSCSGAGEDAAPPADCLL